MSYSNILSHSNLTMNWFSSTGTNQNCSCLSHDVLRDSVERKYEPDLYMIIAYGSYKLTNAIDL